MLCGSAAGIIASRPSTSIFDSASKTSSEISRFPCHTPLLASIAYILTKAVADATLFAAGIFAIKESAV